MKRPPSVTFIGIAGLVLATFDIATSSQGVLVPWFYTIWERLVRTMISKQPQSPGGPDPAAAEFMHQFVGTMSPAITRRLIAMSLIGLAAGGAYLLASGWFLMMRRRSVGLLGWAITASLIGAVARGLTLFSAGGMMLLGILPATLAGIVFDLVLLIFLLTAGRSASYKISVTSVPPVVEARE